MIQKTVLLRCSRAKAFALFTESMSDWWPVSRRHTKDPHSEIVIEPTGRFCERAGDGQVVELGRVREWSAPERLVLDFYVASGPEQPTEVVVTFRDEAGGTRVVVDHAPTERSHKVWQKRAEAYERSWDAVLEALAEADRRAGHGA